MNQMPEQAVISAMGIDGFDPAIDAVCALLESIGYHDTARILRARADETSGDRDW